MSDLASTFISVKMGQLRSAANDNGCQGMSDVELLDLTWKVIHEFQEDGFWEEFAFQCEEASRG